MITEYIKFEEKDIKKIITYLLKDFKTTKSLFEKIGKYTSVYNNKQEINEKEIKFFNSIPVSEKYKLKLPENIYRGMSLSEKMISKIKAKKSKIIFKPLQVNYAGWTFSEKIANYFSQGIYSDKFTKGLIFFTRLTSENKFIDITLAYLIIDNVRKYVVNLKKPNKKLTELYDVMFITSRYSEQEILVFGKIKIDKVYNSF